MPMSKAYEKFKDKIQDPNVKKLEVTPGEFQELINDPLSVVGIKKPEPPVKFCKKEVRTIKKWFRTKTLVEVEFIEYDHHAPEYLGAMARWENESRQIKNGVYFMGKLVVLKDDVTDMVIA